MPTLPGVDGVTVLTDRSLLDGRVLIVLNLGLGNRVMAAPLIEQLVAAHPDLRYSLLGSPLPAGILRAAHPGRAEVDRAALPPLWRRFRRADHPAILEFLRTEGIGLVLNLRKENSAEDGDYLAFRGLAERHGVACWDLHELVDADSSYLEQCRQLLARHGHRTDRLDTRWLTGIRRPAGPSVGLFLGASTELKRWPAGSWRRLVERLLAQHPAATVTITSGTSAAEEELLAEVAAGWDARRVRAARLPSVDGLVRWSGGLTVLVTGDTAAAHLAAAQGGRVIALYFSTLASVWAPDAPADRLVRLQSPVGVACPQMRANGTCGRTYLGCPAPCRDGVPVGRVAAAVLRLLRAAADEPHRAGGAG